ncbi:hypothetical protein F4779DRAFT_479384 [Xylariaceae sp. FL0662B]|nr:hypothetical protein F4779DRAFT_479384 [Xylariaceae sp. FL0662B]
MLLRRQLQRSLSRSVATAWRPAPTTTPPLHGSSPLRNNHSKSPDGNGDASPAPPTPPGRDGHDDASASQKQPSLFEQLFPKEAKQQARASQSNRTPNGGSNWLSQLLEEQPSLTVPEDIPQALDGARRDEASEVAPRDVKGMLILSGASKYLLESDFLRVGIKGRHVEGWVSGIVKVIQGRDRDTLQPRGHYFILFDSHEAAVAYKAEAERLWRLGKTYIPGAHHRKDSERRQPVPAGLRTERGEDVAKAIRSFTLFPPSQRYSLELAAAHYSPRYIEELNQGDAFVDRLVEAAGSPHLVLVSMEGGRVSVDALRQAIDEDGADRNLPWRVADLDKGIMPFGRSVLTKESRDFEQSLWDQAARAMENEDDAWKLLDAVDDKGYRRYPRFIVPFVDDAEAHRFVMSWHRRELTLRTSHEENNRIRDETRIVNAQVLW